MASNPNQVLTLTGILATTDSYDRLRLALVDVLPSRERDFRRGTDSSWARLRAAIPESDNYSVPYYFPLNGISDDAGIRGECWITIPGGRGHAAQNRRQRLLALAVELRGKEVVATVIPKRYSFISKENHNYDTPVAGTSLQLRTLERIGT